MIDVNLFFRVMLMKGLFLFKFHHATDNAMRLLPVSILSLVLMSGCALAQSRKSVPAQLVEQWFTGNTSTIEYVNRSTGSSDTGGGNRFGYVINADGTYVQLGIAKAGLYGCSTVIFNYQPGTYEVSGSTITLMPSEDYLSYKDSCNPHTNSEKSRPPVKKVFEYHIKTNEDDGREYFCINAEGGESCYARAESKS